MIVNNSRDALLQLLVAVLVAFVIFLWVAIWELFHVNPAGAPTVRSVFRATVSNPALWLLAIPAFYGVWVYLKGMA